MSQNLVKKIRLVQNSHKFLSKSLGCGKETLQSAPPIVVHYQNHYESRDLTPQKVQQRKEAGRG